LGGFPDKPDFRRESARRPVEEGPRIVLTKKVSSSEIILQWNGIEGVDGYQVYGRIVGKQWRPMHQGVINETSFKIYNKYANTKFEFAVRAMVNDKVLSLSNIVKVH
jgi:hypothetical protein